MLIVVYIIDNHMDNSCVGMLPKQQTVEDHVLQCRKFF